MGSPHVCHPTARRSKLLEPEPDPPHRGDERLRRYEWNHELLPLFDLLTPSVSRRNDHIAGRADRLAVRLDATRLRSPLSRAATLAGSWQRQ
jgi:hypothetical protein